MTTERRTTTIVRGATSLLLLLLILGGLPLVLVQEVGWPLPTTVPSLDQIGQAITTGAVEDATIIKALALLVWLAWLNFATAVAVEGIAMARGRQARWRPGGRTAQQFAAQLLTSVSLAVSLLGRPAIATTAPDPAGLRLAVATALADQPAPASEGARPLINLSPIVDHHAGQSVQELRKGDGRSYLVQRGDTLWDIAERFLGDGLRWREIRDGNVGRPQPDGVSLRSTDEDIRPGWTLVIPHRLSEESSPSTADAVAEHVTVVPGDTLWDIADEHLGDPYRWPDVYEENEGRPQPDGRTLSDPDLIQPGWVLDMPTEQPLGTTAESAAAGVDPVPDDAAEAEPSTIDTPVAEPTTVEPRSPEADGPATTSRDHAPISDIADAQKAPTEPEDTSTHAEQQSPYFFATAAAGLAAGVVLTLDRIRRARRRRREPGTRIPLPEGEAALAEQRLRVVADEDMYRFVDLALRDLARSCVASRVPPVVLVSYDTEEVRVHLVGTHDAPEGWSTGEDGSIWSRPYSSDLTELEDARGTPSRLPALVTLGTLDSGEVVLLNLAQPGCLHVEGGEDQTEELLRAWALELATSCRADALAIITNGISGLPGGLERLEAVDDPEELRSRLAATPATDSGIPAMVVLAAGMDSDLASWIRVATEQRCDLVAVVVVPPPRPGVWSVRLDGDQGQLNPPDLRFTPLSLDETGLAAASELLVQAKQEDDRPVPIPPLPNEDLIVLDEAPEGSTPQVTVRILGKVCVDGVGSFSANKTMELVVYLAMNREGADADTILEALWPGQRPKPASLYTEAWRARKVLGTAPDGTPYLPDAELGIYRLSEGVALDYEEFQSHVEKARQQPDDAVIHLRAALDLVRGQPLTKTSTEYAWAVHDSYRIAQEIADVAHELAQFLLDAGRYDEATKAAEHGLKAEPGSEALIRDLMEIAAASGNGGRVHDLMTRLRREVAEDVDANDADDYLHPETLATFERLTRGGDSFREPIHEGSSSSSTDGAWG